MKWFKIGAVLLVIVFFVLYLGVNFVDSRSSVLPDALMARLRTLGFALYGYSQEHGRFPDRLEDLDDGSFMRRWILMRRIDRFSGTGGWSMRRASITNFTPSG